jgi:hypothetical protein
MVSKDEIKAFNRSGKIKGEWQTASWLATPHSNGKPWGLDIKGLIVAYVILPSQF